MLLVSDDLVPRIGQWNSYMLGQIGRKLFEGFVLYQPWRGIFETKHLAAPEAQMVRPNSERFSLPVWREAAGNSAAA